MREDTFSMGVSYLKEAFPKRQINYKVYFEALKDLPDESFLKAVLGLIQTQKELYPDSNLIAIIREKVTGPLEDQALLAWTEAYDAIRHHGNYKTVSFLDKVINGTIEAMGGWDKFATMQITEEPFKRKEFITIYEAIKKSGRACPDKLPGHFEKVNGTPEKITYIGANLENKPREIEYASQSSGNISNLHRVENGEINRAD